MKLRLIILPVLIFSVLYTLDAQAKPSLIIMDFSGGAGYDGRNIAAILASQDIIQNSFSLTQNRADYVINGEISKDGFGHMVVFTISRGSTVLGTETIWYRDIIEVSGYMPVVANNLTRGALPRIAAMEQVSLPEFTVFQPLESESQLESPPIVDQQPEAARQLLAARQMVALRQPPDTPPGEAQVTPRQRTPGSDSWRNKWVYLGGSFGYGVVSREEYDLRWEGNQWREYLDVVSYNALALGLKADAALTSWLSAELNLFLFDGQAALPIVARFGKKFPNTELSFNLGLEPIWGSALVGGTFGYRNIYTEMYFGFGENIESFFVWAFGYKFGFGDKKK